MLMAVDMDMLTVCIYYLSAHSAPVSAQSATHAQHSKNDVEVVRRQMQQWTEQYLQQYCV
jgi:hypothetical protein